MKKEKFIILSLIGIFALVGCKKNKPVSSNVSSSEDVFISTSVESISSSESVSSSSRSENLSSSLESEESSSQVSSNIEPVHTNDLFISEFFNINYKKNVYEVYNSNNDKALELYNPLDTSIDLSSYKIKIYGSGSTVVKNDDYIISLSGSLPSKKTYTIVNSYARDVLKEKAVLLSKVFIGPKSAVGLYKNDVLIDVFGVIGKAYSSNDEVVINNIECATDVHNIVRKEGYAACNTFIEEEWDVRFDEDLSSLGKHAQSNDNSFDQELGELALSLLIEEHYKDNNVNSDITFIEEFEGFKFSYKVPYALEYYSLDGKLIKEPSDGFNILIEISLLDDNNNVVTVDYGNLIFKK